MRLIAEMNGVLDLTRKVLSLSTWVWILATALCLITVEVIAYIEMRVADEA